jgi:hypothetical protein
MSGLNTDNLYLYNAVKQLAQGLLGLSDDDGDSIVEVVQLFIEPYPTQDNWVCLHGFGLTRQQEPDGFPAIKQTWDVSMRVGIGNLNAEYGGIQQSKLWERIPTIINWIETHPHLQFAGNTDLPQYLDTTVGVKMRPGSIATRVEELETGKVIWGEFGVLIPFRIQRTIIKYQDGQLVEVY